MGRIYYHGEVDAWGRVLAERIEREVRRGYPEAVDDGDLVFLAARGDGRGNADLPGRNAFAACRALKSRCRARVYLITERDDEVSPEVARFCLADGSVVADGDSLDLSVVERSLGAATARTPVDAALRQVEREMQLDDGSQRASAIQRILVAERANPLIEQLTDPATGLFAGPFANFKLEEEFKRSQRFHQALSLLLLDIGVAEGELEGPEAAIGLAEVASVFLNECRDIDVLARFTESCFLCLLPGTGGAGAAALAGRLLAEFGDRAFSDGLRLVPHAGLATMPAPGIRHRGDFLARAEACLRRAAAGQGVDGLCVSCE